MPFKGCVFIVQYSPKSRHERRAACKSFPANLLYRAGRGLWCGKGLRQNRTRRSIWLRQYLYIITGLECCVNYFRFFLRSSSHQEAEPYRSGRSCSQPIMWAVTAPICSLSIAGSTRYMMSLGNSALV